MKEKLGSISQKDKLLAVSAVVSTEIKVLSLEYAALSQGEDTVYWTETSARSLPFTVDCLDQLSCQFASF